MKVPPLFQNTAIYTIVMVLQRGISFFLLPIYTLYLSPADYGILGVSVSLSSFLSIFLTFSLGAAAGRFYYTHNKDEVYAKRLYGTIVFVVLINSIAFGTIFILCHKWLIDPFLGNIDFYPYIFIGFLNIIITPLYLYFQEYLQTRQEGGYFGINSICFFILNVTLTVVALTVFHLGVVGVLLANLITSFVFFIYAAIFFMRKLSIGIDKTILKESLSYSLPLVAHALANWSNGTLDRLLLNGLKSESVAGLYNLGQQYSSVMNFICNAINQAYVPWFFEKVNHGEHGVRQIAKIAEAIVCLLAFVAVAMSLFSKELLGLMITNPAYDGVWKIIPLLVTAYLFHGLYFFFVNVLFLKDTKLVFTITLVTLIVNIGANVCFIRRYGYMGSAFAFLLTYLTQSVLALIVSTVRNKIIKFNWFRMFLICFVALFVSMSTIFMEECTIWTAVFLKFLIVCVCALLLFIKYKDTLCNLKKNLAHNL